MDERAGDKPLPLGHAYISYQGSKGHAGCCRMPLDKLGTFCGQPRAAHEPPAEPKPRRGPAIPGSPVPEQTKRAAARAKAFFVEVPEAAQPQAASAEPEDYVAIPGPLHDSSLTYAALRVANVMRCEEVFHKLHDWSPTDWACAMAGEVGEACNEVKKLRRLDGADAATDTPEERERLCRKIAAELADTIIYADLLAARLGIDLGEAVRKKFNEVSRKRGAGVFL